MARPKRRDYKTRIDRSRRRPRAPRQLLVRRGISFVAAAALPIWLALNGGGFDVLVSQETSLVLWWAVAVGCAVGMLPRGARDRDLVLPAIGLVALVAWTVLSLTWTESDERTMTELARLLGYAAIVVVAWATLNLYTFRAAAAGLSTAALLIPVIAVASRLIPASFPVDELAVIFDIDRLNYPFDYWNAVAASGAIAFAIGICWSAHARHLAVRAAALSAVPVAGLAVYLTYSRGGVLAVSLAVALAIALSRNRWTAAVNAVAAGAGTGVAILAVRANPAIADATGGEGGSAVAAALLLAALGCAGVAILTSIAWVDRVRLPSRQARVAVPATLAAVLVVGAIAGHGVLADSWNEFLDDDVSGTGAGTSRLSTAGGDRNDLWGSAIDAFESDSLTGIGPGTFEFWWARDGRLQTPVVDAHSLYFETMAELGFVGLLLLLTFLLGMVLTAFRARARLKRTSDLGASAAMIAAFLVFLFYGALDWVWEYPALVVLSLGAVAIASAAASERASGRPLATPVRVAAVAAALVFGAVQIPGIVGTDRLRDSQTAQADGDLDDALAAAEDAVSAQSWAASALAQRAVVEEELGDLEAARNDLLEAREQEPTNWLLASQLARVQSKLGDGPAAAAARRDAERLNRIGS